MTASIIRLQNECKLSASLTANCIRWSDVRQTIRMCWSRRLSRIFEDVDTLRSSQNISQRKLLNLVWIKFTLEPTSGRLYSKIRFDRTGQALKWDSKRNLSGAIKDSIVSKSSMDCTTLSARVIDWLHVGVNPGLWLGDRLFLLFLQLLLCIIVMAFTV